MQGNNKYKIVASDLDGTFIRDDHTISRENLLAVREMKQLCVEFVPTTGRSLAEIPRELLDSEDIRYFITSDGAAVYDKALGRMIVTSYFPCATVKFILETVRKYTAYPLAHVDGKNYYDAKSHNIDNLSACKIDRYFVDIIEDKNFSISDYDNFVKSSDKVEMFCIFFGKQEEREECRRIFSEIEGISLASSAPNNLEVYMSNAGKGNALLALAKKLGAEANELIGVGDSTNDASLVEAAGLGLAMENASEELKMIADKTICDSSEHSAKYILENFILSN